MFALHALSRLPLSLWSATLCLLAVLVGCSGGESESGGNNGGRPNNPNSRDTGTCLEGMDGCACFGNGTCDSGLVCTEGVCVSESCEAGDLRCPCYRNGTCNEGLSCESGLCMSPSDGSDDVGVGDAGGGSSSDTGSPSDVGTDAGGGADSGGETDIGNPTDEDSGMGADAGSENDSGPADPTPNPNLIGPAGGTIESEGVTLIVPPGALSAEVEIRITRSASAVPSGFDAYSPRFTFEPTGLTFAIPATVKVPFAGDSLLAALFWSRPASEGGGWERLGGTATGPRVESRITHFSDAFVASGVAYEDPADRACTRTRLLERRTNQPANVALFFTVEDCQGRPITNLTESDFVIKEDNRATSGESVAVVLPNRGQHVFVHLVLDVSSSIRGNMAQLIDGAKSFVERLEAENLPVQVSISLFAGDDVPAASLSGEIGDSAADLALLDEWQRPTLDLTTLIGRMDDIATYAPTDVASTNLYGAVLGGLKTLDYRQRKFRERNHGGAFTAGYLVVFTDGFDTANRHAESDVRAAIAATTNDVVAVGLQGVDYDPATIALLGRNFAVSSPDVNYLRREFGTVANRIAGQFSGTYLLGYCSPSRAGTHSVSVEVSGSTSNAASATFDATGFGPGCTRQAFEQACDGKECGGLGCGACGADAKECDPIPGLCVDYVVPEDILIPSGSFVQGPNPWVGDNISRTVTISRPFYMQNTEVTQGQWESLIGNNPSSFSGCADCPVETVSWWDAVAYMNAASARAGLESCYTLSGCTGTAGSNLSCTGVTFSGLSCLGYRLPTEAEWEYAARAGTTGNYYGELDAIAWYSSNSGSRTQPVGMKLPNAFGLYDMLGNVWEWNWDWYAAYTSANVTDPLGPNTGSRRVLRGGGWFIVAEFLVVSFRDSSVPGLRFNGLGFRPSRSVP